MKKILFTILITSMPLLCLSQGMKIKWEDYSGREFSINTHSGQFQYSMIPGDEIKYNDKYDDKYGSGIVGKVKSIGNVKIEYYDKYDDKYGSGIVGKVKSVGNIKTEYYDKYDDKYGSGIAGKLKSVGRLKIYYNDKYDNGPAGSIKSTSGSVN
jgi:hypothetical protein